MGKGRNGSRAGIAAIAAIAGLAVVATPAEAAEWTIEAHAEDALWHPAQRTVQTHDTVTWKFLGGYHNVKATSSNWDLSTPAPTTADTPYTFDAPGTYTFVCEIHELQGMTGTITVQDEPVDPPPDDPPPDDPPPDDTPPPSSPPPSGTPHPVTPAPSPVADTVKPSVRRVKLKALRRAVRVRFRLSEPATVTVRAKRGRRVVVSKRVQASAGTHTITLRSKRLKKGRYVVQILARDAFGNRSKAANKRLALRR